MTGSSGAGRGKRVVWLVLAGALLFLGFIALGTWQVERRAWKLDLIARVDRRIHAPAVPAPGPDRWSQISAAADEYRHVFATGVFLDEEETVVQAVTQLGPGFWLLTPLRLADGSTILVNRGFVRERAPRPTEYVVRPPRGMSKVAEPHLPMRRQTTPAVPDDARPVTVEGLLRLTEPGGGFLRRNDAAARRWYSRDVAAIAAAHRLSRVAPYFIDAAATPGPGRRADEPLGGLTVVAFHNSHLVYAITWYTLALGVVVAGWQVAREERRRGRV